MGKQDFQELLKKSDLEVQRLIREQKRYSEVFRNRYEHTLRVLTWAGRIQMSEGGDLEIITLAVLFHDVGWSQERNHADVSAELTEDFLRKNQVETQIADKIVSVVRTHNLREISNDELPIENQIVMDADLLDEVGVTTLVWDALKTGGGTEPSYKKVLEKDRIFYSNSVKNKGFLKTKTGLKLYDERLGFWKSVLNNLAYELGETELRG
jgi:uncharacterized protein